MSIWVGESDLDALVTRIIGAAAATSTVAHDISCGDCFLVICKSCAYPHKVLRTEIRTNNSNKSKETN
jgi:hypothetical protein